SSLAGSGSFDCDEDFAAVHVLGTLASGAAHLGVLAPSLEPLGAVALTTRFDLTRIGRQIRVDSLSISLAGDRPAVALRSVQPFSIDEATGSVAMSDPGGNLADVSVQGLALDRLSGLTGGASVVGGAATGEFLIREANGGLELRPKAPLAA